MDAQTDQVKTIWSPGGNFAQWALLECPVFEVFFGGSRGGGKTDAMLGEWISHADLHGENAIGLMVRRERTQLVEVIEPTNSMACGKSSTLPTWSPWVWETAMYLMSAGLTPS